MSTRRVIVNADDLGRSHGINQGVATLRQHRHGRERARCFMPKKSHRILEPVEHDLRHSIV